MATAGRRGSTGLTERFSRDFPDTYALADAPCGGPDGGGLRVTTAWPARYSASAHGLAHFLRDERVSLASAGDNLTVMVAGSVMQDPLELLRRPRRAALLALLTAPEHED